MMRRTLRVHPFDDFPGSGPAAAGPPFLEELAAATARVFGLEALLGGSVRLPDAAYNHRRRQYMAGDFLTMLERERDGESPVLGVTAVDLFLPRLNFVFGVADPEAGVAVISLQRLSPEFYEKKQDRALLLARAVKETVHETGHLLGLSHCEQPGCVMHFSNAIADTDSKGPGFCEDCLARLAP